MVGAIRELCEFELSEVEAAVGASSFKRGRGYARGNRVVSIQWDPSEEALSGSVVGQGALYRTTAYFAGDGEGSLEFGEGECTCPVGYNCKHVAAIVIAATPAAGSSRSRTQRRAPDASLDRAAGAFVGGAAAGARGRTGGGCGGDSAGDRAGPALRRLAGRGAPRLEARLMRPAARGGWVNGSLTWSGLDSWQGQGGEYRPDQVAAPPRAARSTEQRRDRRGYYYGYAADGRST